MNWELYNQQNDFGKLYMLGIEQAIHHRWEGLELTIRNLELDAKIWPQNTKILEYIHTLRYIRK